MPKNTTPEGKTHFYEVLDTEAAVYGVREGDIIAARHLNTGERLKSDSLALVRDGENNLVRLVVSHTKTTLRLKGGGRAYIVPADTEAHTVLHVYHRAELTTARREPHDANVINLHSWHESRQAAEGGRR